VHKMVAGILTADGFDVFAAASLAEAHEHVERNGRRIDLLIIDPGDAPRDGERLARQLLQRHSEARVVWTPSENAEPLRDLPVERQASLPKPFALRALLRTVHGLLDGHADPETNGSAKDPA